VVLGRLHGTRLLSLRDCVGAPIVARGSSPARTPSAFPLGSSRKSFIGVAPLVALLSDGLGAFSLTRSPDARYFSRNDCTRVRFARTHPRLRAGARRASLGKSVRKWGRSAHTRGPERRCGYRPMQGGEGVLAGDDPRATIGAATRSPSDRCLVPRHLLGPQRARARSRRGHPHRPRAEMLIEAPRSATRKSATNYP
jgi:hypothetical protein